MASTYLYIAIALLLISSLFLIAIVQNCVDDGRILATPTIPVNNGILTSFASIRINATTEEVFQTLMSFKDYSKWSSFSEHQWEKTTDDGIPLLGSKGTLKVRWFALLFVR
jgi:hypothetical protein